MRFFVEINLFINLVKVKCSLRHCTRFLPKLPIRHKSWPNVYAKSNSKQSRVLQIIGTKTQKSPRTDLSQTRPQSPFNVLIAKDNIIQIDIISVIRHLVLNAQNSENECYRKNNVGLKELN